MNPLSLSCPWGKKKPDLSNIALTVEEKKWIVDAVTSKYKNVRMIAETYSLNEKTIRSWVHRVRDGNSIHNGTGRPPVFTEKVKEIMKGKLVNAGHAIRASDFRSQCQDSLEKVLEDEGLAGLDTSFSRSTLKKFQNDLGLKDGNAEVTTDARALACASSINIT